MAPSSCKIVVAVSVPVELPILTKLPPLALRAVVSMVNRVSAALAFWTWKAVAELVLFKAVIEPVLPTVSTAVEALWKTATLPVEVLLLTARVVADPDVRPVMVVVPVISVLPATLEPILMLLVELPVELLPILMFCTTAPVVLPI